MKKTIKDRNISYWKKISFIFVLVALKHRKPTEMGCAISDWSSRNPGSLRRGNEPVLN